MKNNKNSPSSRTDLCLFNENLSANKISVLTSIRANSQLDVTTSVFIGFTMQFSIQTIFYMSFASYWNNITTKINFLFFFNMFDHIVID